MLAVIQRVNFAKVTVSNQTVGEIKKGILALIGIKKADNTSNAERLIERILTYRIFEDADDKMNLSIKDISGGLLLVPQFTIVADTKSGTRPGFSTAMEPDASSKLFNYLVNNAKQKYSDVASGQFGANMQVSLCNDEPVTFILET